MGSDDRSGGRRQALKELSGGLFLAAAGSAFAQQETPSRSQAAEPAFLPDFPTEYPRPPFPKQAQPWPGLASKMTPRPDHGETSYRGSGRLAGRKALITGGDSGMGRAAAIAFAREGADVAINYLPAEESDAAEVIELIHRAGRKGVALPGDIRDEAFCNQYHRANYWGHAGPKSARQLALRRVTKDELPRITHNPGTLFRARRWRTDRG
jgi:hypothetical protein